MWNCSTLTPLTHFLFHFWPSTGVFKMVVLWPVQHQKTRGKAWRWRAHCHHLQPTSKKQPRLITSSVQRHTPENMFIILIQVFVAGWLPSGLPDVSLFTMVEADYDVPVHFSFTDSLVLKMCQTLRALFSKARSTHNSTPMTVHADTTKPYDRQLTQCYFC